jgi:NADPH:quinone reductase-like Zn-dependent oxidoreductase
LRRAELQAGGDKILIREDFTKDGARYDIVFDAVGKSSFRRCRWLLRPRGVFLFTGLGFLWHAPLLVALTRFSGTERVIIPVPWPEQRDIQFLKTLVEDGAFAAVIDRRYPLDAIVEAYRYVETGQKIGNVVITVGGPLRPDPPVFGATAGRPTSRAQPRR